MAKRKPNPEMGEELSQRIVEFPDDSERFIRTKDLGEKFDFRDVREAIAGVIQLVDELSLSSGWTSIPTAHRSLLVGQLDDAKAKLDGLLAFGVGHPNAPKVRQERIDQMEYAWRDLFNAVDPVLTIDARAKLSKVKSDATAHIDAAIEEFQHIKDEGRKLTEELRDKNEVARRTLASIAKAAVEVGVSKEAQRFQKEAEQHAKAGTTWLRASWAIGAIIVVLSIILMFTHFSMFEDGADGKWALIQQIGARLLLISILSFLLVFAVRNYSTRRHLEVVNQHRANALSVFEVFLAGAATKEIKDAVLLEATKACFASQRTGYLRKEGEQSPSIQILEVIRSMTSSGEK